LLLSSHSSLYPCHLYSFPTRRSSDLTSSKNKSDGRQYETKEVQTLSDLERKLLAIIQYENNQDTSSYFFIFSQRIHWTSRRRNTSSTYTISPKKVAICE